MKWELKKKVRNKTDTGTTHHKKESKAKEDNEIGNYGEGKEYQIFNDIP